MGTEVTDPARYEFAPAEADGVAFGLNVVQMAIVVTTLMLVITASRGGVPLWGLVPLSVPVLAFGTLRWRGDRLPTVSARWVSWMLRPRRHTQKTPAAVAVPAGDDGEADAEVASDAIDPPGWARRLRLIRAPYREGEVGVWHDGDAWVTVLAVSAPATALRDLDEQDSLLAGWGELLASSGVEGSPVQRIAWVARTSPDQGAGAAAWVREHGDPAIKLTQPSIWRSYVEVGEAAGAHGASRELLVVMRIQPDRARHRLRGVRGQEERERRCAELTIEETERIGGRLVELGCAIEGLYTPEAVAAVVRTTYDPTARDDLGWWTAAGNLHGVNPATGMWPLSHEEAADHVRTDGGFHRVGWVEEWPTVPVLATWMHPLLLRSGWTRTVAMVMEPVPTHSAVRATHRARAAAASEAEVRARHGFISSARSERGWQAAEQREQELVDGHRDMRFAAYVCVTGRTLAELEEAWAHTVYEAAQAKLRLRALHGQHWPALQAVLPLGRFI